MMAKRGAGGESAVIKVNIPISKASSPLSFPLMLVRKTCQLIPGRPYPMHDRSF